MRRVSKRLLIGAVACAPVYFPLKCTFEEEIAFLFIYYVEVKHSTGQHPLKYVHIITCTEFTDLLKIAK